MTYGDKYDIHEHNDLMHCLTTNNIKWISNVQY